MQKKLTADRVKRGFGPFWHNVSPLYGPIMEKLTNKLLVRLHGRAGINLLD